MKSQSPLKSPVGQEWSLKVMNLEDSRSYWNDLARLDAMWASLFDAQQPMQHHAIQDFFQTGMTVAERVLNWTNHYQIQRADVMELGCGIGRIIRHLAPHFERALGLDLSNEMIEQAKIINHGLRHLDFQVNVRPDLGNMTNECMDVVVCYNTFPFIPTPDMVHSYMKDMFRVLRPKGLLVIQTATHVPALQNALKPSLFEAFKTLGLPDKVLYTTLKLYRHPMLVVSESDLQGLITQCGGRLLLTETETDSRLPITSKLLVAAKK